MSVETPFVAWARETLVPLAEDLAPLGEMIADASIVALGEGIHGAAEPLEFRNQLFQYLVQEKGFTAIALESGFAAGRIVHDYVRGGVGDLAEIMAHGFTWTFGRLSQNRDLVQRLRQYNAHRERARKINFYGFDVPAPPKRAQAVSDEPSSEEIQRLLEIEDLRDRTQADNIEWIVEQEGPAGKVLLFAHRYHLSTTPLTRAWRSPGMTVEHVQDMAGAYLRRRYGKQVITIGNLIGQGELRCGDYTETLERAPPESIDGIAGALGVPRFLLDLRGAPAPVMSWLNQKRSQRRPRYTFSLRLGDAFDILLYLDAVTPAGDTHS